ncbi:MAG: ABC transporter permease, partial [Proteobacteria bacterium]|nr:ABC transporter permease [Pseudomonadota bacterium]
SNFLYNKIPDVWLHIKSYTQYRFECGLRSSAILGFIGLPTLGFTLESAFSQGYYSQVWAILILFYVVISTIGFWMRRSLLPVYLIAAIILLPPMSTISFDNIVRFLSVDIVPYPLRVAEQMNAGAIIELGNWFWSIMTTQALPGIWNTLVLTQIALVTAAILTLLLFPLVCNKFFSRPSRTVGHVLLVVLRSTPEYILAYILLQLWGPSMLPAVIAITIHNGAIIGYLTGRHASSLNLRIDSSVKRINRYFFEVLPRVYGQFLAFLFYRWEIIFRETAILGILGISTLGFYIDSAIQDLRMDRALLLIIVTALINILIDTISRRLRSRLRLNFRADAGSTQI